jgi:trk system potassium uptake protein TrkH
MDRLNSILFVVGVSLSKVSGLLLFPCAYAFISETHGSIEFLATSLIAFILAFLFMRPGTTINLDFKTQDIFLITLIIWIIDCLFSALPFYFILHCSYTNAFFETMSGLTTFGGTVFTNLDSLPHSILLWRSMLQWVGGVGFVVIAVAILPKLNVGGMKLFQSENSEKNKETPKTTTLAKNIIFVYIITTTCCFICYMCCGMNYFDAICHAFTTLATGGFSTHNASMGAFNANAQWVCILFMIIGSLPFMLYVKCFKRNSLSYLFKNQQVAGYLKFIVFVGIALSIYLYIKNNFTVGDSLRYGLFNVVSIVTTSGFALGDWASWGEFASMMVLFILPLGGCTGGTSGGIKYFRIQIISVLFKRQCKELLHPLAIIPQTYNGHQINDSIIRSVVAFFLSYMLVLMVSSLIITFDDIDIMVALTSSISAISNVGPSFGSPEVIAATYDHLPTMTKWILSADMLCGRLEILTVMVLFFPKIWNLTEK